MSELARRKRGRPKGSKNKKSNLSTATVRQICDYHNFNAAEKLIRIANDEDTDRDGNRIAWPKTLQARATEKLFDAIHGKSALPGDGVDSDQQGQQFNLVFVESDGHFALPGAGSTEGAPDVLRGTQIQRTGLPSSDGENGICVEQADTGRTDLSTD